jgi:hypothetical protein
MTTPPWQLSNDPHELNRYVTNAQGRTAAVMVDEAGVELLVAEANAAPTLRARIEELEHKVAVWEANAAFACETPLAACDCSGCSLAREFSA